MGEVATKKKQHSMLAKLKGLISLLRLTFHHNYGMVFLGAYGFGPQSVYESFDLLFLLMVSYVPFNIFLYGGIYTMNAITDVDMDRVHPVKKNRPVASGLVSIAEASLFGILMVILAFITVYLQFGDMRLWPHYTCFLIANILYSTKFRRMPRLRALIGITTPLRLWMGTTLAQGEYTYNGMMCAMAMMCTIQELRAKLDRVAVEGFGILALDRELTWLSLTLIILPQAYFVHRLWLFIAFILGLITFIVLPFLHPTWGGFLVSADLPKDGRRINMWVEVQRYLWKAGAYYEIFLHGFMFSVWSFVQRVFMEIEDLVIPGLLTSSPPKTVWIQGHYRSGTTSLHKALASHPNAVSATMFDLFCPSLTFKYFMAPVARFFMWLLVYRFDVEGHASGMGDLMEEDTFAIYHSSHFVINLMFVSLPLGENPLCDKALEATDAHMNFVQRCINRVWWLRGGEGKVYVGKPLSWTCNRESFYKRYPDSTVIMCLRSPLNTFPSWISLCQDQLKPQHNFETNPQFRTWLQKCLYPVTKNFYEDMAKIVKDPIQRRNVTVVPFETWVSDRRATLQALKDKTTLDFTDLPVEDKPPTHKNPSTANQVVEKKQMESEVVPFYNETIKLSKDLEIIVK